MAELLEEKDTPAGVPFETFRLPVIVPVLPAAMVKVAGKSKVQVGGGVQPGQVTSFVQISGAQLKRPAGVDFLNPVLLWQAPQVPILQTLSPGTMLTTLQVSPGGGVGVGGGTYQEHPGSPGHRRQPPPPPPAARQEF